MSVWTKVTEAMAAGEDPVVVLSYAKHLLPVEAKKRGPKPKPRPFAELNLRGKPLGVVSRRRCWNPYCRKRLTNGALYVCNDGCRELAVEHLTAALHRLQPPYGLTAEEAIGITRKVFPAEFFEEPPNVPIFRVAGEAIRNSAGEGREEKAGRQARPRGRRPKAVAARATKRA